jgi:hypothetical protein
MFIFKYPVKMAAMNSISQPTQSSTPTAVLAMLSYTANLLLAETATATDTAIPDLSNLTLDHVARRATATTITIRSSEGYTHYGIND